MDEETGGWMFGKLRQNISVQALNQICSLWRAKHVGSRRIFPVAGLCVSVAFRAPLQTEEEAQKKDNASIDGCFKS